jgi:hypothetical protein
MKTTNILFALALLLSTFAFAQVGIGTTEPKGALDITSTTSGLVLPRVTDLSLVKNPNGGGAPVNGTMVYDVTANCTKTYENGAWSACLANANGFTHYLGEAFDGGIIYSLYKGSDGLEHGLIVALTENTVAWQTSGTLVNANRSWDGAYNTALMTGSPAASYIAGLGAGWYLPSIDELGKLYYNRFETNKALFTGGNTLLSNTARYWSSTEFVASNAYNFDFFFGFANHGNKTSTLTVRGVRAF